MGIDIQLTKLLIQEAKKESFSGNVLTLGEQDVRYGVETLKQILIEENYFKVSNLSVKIDKRTKVIKSESLFKALGFEKKYSLDYSSYEEADLIWDLNTSLISGNVPENMKKYEGFFDVIIDAGTTEHVFNFKSSLENIFYFLKPNGRIIHCVPSSHNFDHGFYMFSPCIFHDYYIANNYLIKDIKLASFDWRKKTHWSIVDYNQSMYNFRGLKDGNTLYYIYCVAKKTAESTPSINPMQGFYTKIWDKNKSTV